MAGQRTVVVTTPAAYGGAACPDLQLTACADGDGSCVTMESAPAPVSVKEASGGTLIAAAASTVAAILAVAALF